MTDPRKPGLDSQLLCVLAIYMGAAVILLVLVLAVVGWLR
jgi:hypothetical protein